MMMTTMCQVIVDAKEDQVLGAKYFIAKDTPVSVLMRVLHHDPKVWGDDHCALDRRECSMVASKTCPLTPGSQ